LADQGKLLKKIAVVRGYLGEDERDIIDKLLGTDTLTRPAHGESLRERRLLPSGIIRERVRTQISTIVTTSEARRLINFSLNLLELIHRTRTLAKEWENLLEMRHGD
jgi:hypothetical protein